MGGAARPLHDPGKHRSIERGSNPRAARCGSLRRPAKPAGERENDAALTPQPGTRSWSGTWEAAVGAVRFYRRHGFELVPEKRKTSLLETYWTVPARQIEASVVLANPPFEAWEVLG